MPGRPEPNGRRQAGPAGGDRHVSGGEPVCLRNASETRGSSSWNAFWRIRNLPLVDHADGRLWGRNVNVSLLSILQRLPLEKELDWGPHALSTVDGRVCACVMVGPRFGPSGQLLALIPDPAVPARNIAGGPSATEASYARAAAWPPCRRNAMVRCLAGDSYARLLMQQSLSKTRTRISADILRVLCPHFPRILIRPAASAPSPLSARIFPRHPLRPLDLRTGVASRQRNTGPPALTAHPAGRRGPAAPAHHVDVPQIFQPLVGVLP
ncbi:hypothetical protein FA95DRAFT_741955 [Auriscalpium vulgare]|uniref:Uncharacterized protein n=1 Tax=Auriscalpium vulgare TaxID=40419 RepID=A0ACB8SC72_9AGAM|nr:hypothetical protein FA95DRAFT_741955 [Auriscalpium vulgare]